MRQKRREKNKLLYKYKLYLDRNSFYSKRTSKDSSSFLTKKKRVCIKCYKSVEKNSGEATIARRERFHFAPARSFLRTHLYSLSTNKKDSASSRFDRKWNWLKWDEKRRRITIVRRVLGEMGSTRQADVRRESGEGARRVGGVERSFSRVDSCDSSYSFVVRVTRSIVGERRRVIRSSRVREWSRRARSDAP